MKCDIQNYFVFEHPYNNLTVAKMENKNKKVHPRKCYQTLYFTILEACFYLIKELVLRMNFKMTLKNYN